MGAIATFSYPQWIDRFPELSYVSNEEATELFNEATVYWANDGSGPASTTTIQLTILNYVLAHLVALFRPKGLGCDGQTSLPGIVGRINNATEGSVSVSTEYKVGNAQQWWSQTRYGDAFWQLTRVYRTFQFRRGHPRNNPPFPPPNFRTDGGFFPGSVPQSGGLLGN